VRHLACIALLLVVGCLRTAESRTRSEETVGIDQAAGISFRVQDGLAQITGAGDGYLGMWAQSPVLRIDGQVDATAATQWTIEVDNCLSDAVLTATLDGAQVAVTQRPDRRPTLRSWQFTLPSPPTGALVLSLSPPDSDDLTPWRFAAMADIQQGLNTVHQMFERINAEPDVRFVVAMGDLVEDGEEYEYEKLVEQYKTLNVPFYATIGNHELKGSPEQWQRRFGLFNVHFTFRGVAFSLVDSGNATIDPIVYDRLDGWLAQAQNDLHVFLTHIPPIDAIGIRAGAFRSRNEASKLLTKLADGNVDLTLYGHIHSFYDYTNAGIPAYISGGGGATDESLDGIERHFLVMDADPQAQTIGVTKVSVD